MTFRFNSEYAKFLIQGASIAALQEAMVYLRFSFWCTISAMVLLILSLATMLYTQAIPVLALFSACVIFLIGDQCHRHAWRVIKRG